MRKSKNKSKEKPLPIISGYKPNRYLAWYIFLPVFVLICASAPWQRTVANFFAPYLEIGNSVSGAFADQTVKLHSRKKLADEVMRLRKQNLELAVQNTVYKRLAEENRQLRSMLKLSVLPGYEYASCDILLRDPWLWNNGFTINLGSKDGLQPGLAVIAPAPDRAGRVVLLGVIESVSKFTSHVISVLNPEFSISVSLPESGAVGFLNAGGFEHSAGNMASVGFLPSNSTFAINEQIFTTGFEASIPGGLWVGSLASIEQHSMPFGNRLYRRGLMRPAGNLEHLRSAVVVKVRKTSQDGTSGQ